MYRDAGGCSPAVYPIVERYLALVDAALPGRVEGLYLVGSVALGDYWPEHSDIDFVAVTAAPLGPEELVSFGRVHDELRQSMSRPYFDGVYVTWDELAQDPRSLAPPYAHESRFYRAGGFEANPSVWLTLHRYPVVIRGPEAPTVWHDDCAIRQWNVENLNTYWRRAANQRSRFPVRVMLVLSERALRDTVTWCVPGVARLHYTVATGDVTSKSGACRYALDALPFRWSAIITEALNLRSGGSVPQRSRRERLRDVVDFVDFVIRDAPEMSPRLAPDPP